MLTTDELFAQLTDSIPASTVSAGADVRGVQGRLSRPDFGTWLADVARTGKGCTHPVRLAGRVDAVDPRTGEVVHSFDTAELPDGVLYKPCGTRRASACPACAEVYRYDTYQLIAAGLRGGKGVPDSVAEHPALFATFTAPSFGAVHTRATNRVGKVLPCRARRDRPICSHGRPAFCAQRHRESDSCLGRPLCPVCYDYEHQAVWNAFVPVLWARTIDRLTRLLHRHAKATGVTVKLRYAKVAEFQARGVVHLHAIFRFDGYNRDQPEAILAPPPCFTADLLAGLIRRAATDTSIATPAHPDRPGGWPATWGRQLDTTPVRAGVGDAELTEQHVAGYLAKYATKSTEAVGTISARITGDTIDAHADASHVGRLIGACWHLGRSAAGEHYARLRRWAHMLGFGGHFSTKSRRYSTTLTALCAARRPKRPCVRLIGPDELDTFDTSDEEETTLVVNREWKYAGTGWLTLADAALAIAAAASARERRPVRSTDSP